MNETHFMPSVGFVNQHGDAVVNSVLKDGSLDLPELRKFVEPVLIVEHRSLNNTSGSDDGYKRILYQMRMCTKEDYISKKYKVTPMFETKLKSRICPDINKDDEKYMVKNLYDNTEERLAFSVQILKCK